MSFRSNLLLYGAIAALAFAGDVHTTSAASCIPGFDFAVFARDQIEIQGNAGTDSWDSSAGTYAATSTCADGSVGTNATAGGSIHIQGASSKICGDAWVGAGGNPSTVITGNGNITGGRQAQPSNLTLPSVTIPSLPNGSPFNQSFTNTGATLAPGKTYGAISCKNGSLTISTGTYVVNSLSLTANCQLTLGSGPIAIYFKSGLYLQGGAVANNTAVPSNLVFFGGPGATDVQLQGGAKAFFAVYAPSASCQIQGNADIWGAIVCDDAHIQGNAHIHYDKALRNFDGGGFTCTTTEISRASPIVATIGNQDAVVQGTFESPSGAPRTIATTADVATFAFPYIKGHMRARTAASITTTASSFSSGTVLFDAGAIGKIPAASFAGCSTFNGTCRHLFTVTSAPAPGAVTPLHPEAVPWDDAHASEIGALIAPASTVPGIGAAHWQTIERTVLAAPLGGVDRSTAAVIPPSTIAGASSRPTIVYFGATDGMLHAVCGSTGGSTPSQTNICPSLGTELWAFAPRVALPLMRTNTARVDGSPHVLDAFGDFADPPTGNRSWHTILLFQTGYQGTSTAATYALDITDPANPSVVWEYTTPGAGMTIASGQVTILAAPTYLAFVETGNGATAGVVLTALNLITGEPAWQFVHPYESPPRGVSTDLPLPASGVPGGAAAVDLVGTGFVTDVVFGDLYGSLWRLNAANGDSRTGDEPLFRFTGNKHPIGVAPAIYANGGRQYAVFASGGYVDPLGVTWSASTQYAIAVKLEADAPPVDETAIACGNCDLALRETLTAGDKGFAQALVVGSQLFLTTDSTDVNSATFGTGAGTGHLMTIDLATETVSAPVVISAGASTIAHAGTSLYTSSAQQQQELSVSASTTTGAATEITGGQKFLRQLWLQTE